MLHVVGESGRIWGVLMAYQGRIRGVKGAYHGRIRGISGAHQGHLVDMFERYHCVFGCALYPSQGM